MTYNVNQFQKANINGQNSIYSNSVDDESIKYGKNSANNFKNYALSPLNNIDDNQAPVFDFAPTSDAIDKNLNALDKFTKKNDEYLDSLPPLEFEYRYMPNLANGKPDKKALLGAADEELGVTEIPVKEFEQKYMNENMTAEPLDINKDGKIDVKEYATTIAAADMMSKDSQDVSQIDGTINSKGMNAILAYSAKSRAEAATKLYSNIYNTLNLGSTDT